MGNFDLEVCFTIQIAGLNVTAALFSVRRKEQQISWKELILLYHQHISNIDILPPFGGKLPGGLIQDLQDARAAAHGELNGVSSH